MIEDAVAELRGRSLRERAQLFIGVAQPAFRDELGAGAQSAGLLQ